MAAILAVGGLANKGEEEEIGGVTCTYTCNIITVFMFIMLKVTLVQKYTYMYYMHVSL